MKKILSLFAVVSLTLNSVFVSMFLLRYTAQINLAEIKSIDDDGKTPDEKEENEDNLILQEIFTIISNSYNSPIKLIDQLLPYINNKVLSNYLIVNILESGLKALKNNGLEIMNYLSYFKFSPNLLLIINELVNDWDKESTYGRTTLTAMKKFIKTEKGDIAQAKKVGNKGRWHYVAFRAQKWDWDDFYQYMAGANMNYMIKILSQGSYIGNLIDKHLYLGPWTWGFNKDNFLSDFESAIQKLPTTKEAWPYLIKTVIPLLKIKVLKPDNVTLGFNNLTWEKNDSQDLSLKTLLTELKYLLSPEGHNDLVKLFVSILTGPFGEDIIINCGMLGYYTFPEILGWVNSWGISAIIGDGLKPEVLAEQIVNELVKITNKLGLVNIFNDIFTKLEKVNIKDLNINLKDLASDFSTIYGVDNFQIGLNQLIDFISNSTSNYSLSEIFELWGVQAEEKEFKIDSPLFIIRKWIDNPNSMFNQIWNIIKELDKKKILV